MSFAYKSEVFLRDTTTTLAPKATTRGEQCQQELGKFKTYRVLSETKWIRNLQAG